MSGVVEVGPAEWIWAEVWGTGGDVGFTRDDTHAELIAVPAASLHRKPGPLKFDQAASVGVNYIVAWCGLEAAGLRPGDTVLLIGAGGGVGSAAAQIARRLGARVIGADNRMPRSDAPIQAIAEKPIIGAEDLLAEVRAVTGDRTASAEVLDGLTPGSSRATTMPHHRRDLRAQQSARGLPQSGGRRSGECRAAAAGIGGNHDQLSCLPPHGPRY